MSSSEGLPPAAPAPGPVAATPAAETASAAAAVEPAPAADRSISTDPAAELSPERIAERVAILDTVTELPLPEHVALYQRLHAELQSALAQIDGP